MIMNKYKKAMLKNTMNTENVIVAKIKPLQMNKISVSNNLLGVYVIEQIY